MRYQTSRVTRRTFLGGCAGSLAATAGCAVGSAAGPKGPPPSRVVLGTPAPMLPPAQAVLLTVKGVDGGPDEISVVWTFVVNGGPPQVGVSVGNHHVAQKLLAANREFVLNVPVADMVVPFDKIDMATTLAADKFKLSGLTPGKAVEVAAPTIAESPIQVECKVIQDVEVPPQRHLFIAEVVATSVFEGICDSSERLLVEKVPFFGMMAGSGEFYTMGDRVGHIGQTHGAPVGEYRY